LGTATDIGLIEAPLQAALAVRQFMTYARFHSKSLRAWGVWDRHYSYDTAGKLRDFEFFSDVSPLGDQHLRLFRV
jgi:hypothetical protein